MQMTRGWFSSLFASETTITFDRHYARIVDQQTQDYLGSWRPLSVRVTKGPKYPTNAEIIAEREERAARMGKQTLPFRKRA